MGLYNESIKLLTFVKYPNIPSRGVFLNIEVEDEVGGTPDTQYNYMKRQYELP